MSPEGETVKQGWLCLKKPKNGLWGTISRGGKWKRRFVVLKNIDIAGCSRLDIFKDDTLRKKDGCIETNDINQVDSYLVSQHESQFIFDVQLPKTKYYMLAPCEEEMNEWVTLICSLCDLAQANHQPQTIQDLAPAPARDPDPNFELLTFGRSDTCSSLSATSDNAINTQKESCQNVVDAHAVGLPPRPRPRPNGPIRSHSYTRLQDCMSGGPRPGRSHLPSSIQAVPRSVAPAPLPRSISPRSISPRSTSPPSICIYDHSNYSHISMSREGVEIVKKEDKSSNLNFDCVIPAPQLSHGRPVITYTNEPKKTPISLNYSAPRGATNRLLSDPQSLNPSCASFGFSSLPRMPKTVNLGYTRMDGKRSLYEPMNAFMEQNQSNGVDPLLINSSDEDDSEQVTQLYNNLQLSRSVSDGGDMTGLGPMGQGAPQPPAPIPPPIDRSKKPSRSSCESQVEEVPRQVIRKASFVRKPPLHCSEVRNPRPPVIPRNKMQMMHNPSPPKRKTSKSESDVNQMSREPLSATVSGGLEYTEVDLPPAPPSQTLINSPKMSNADGEVRSGYVIIDEKATKGVSKTREERNIMLHRPGIASNTCNTASLDRSHLKKKNKIFS